jgi:histidyl-tRNA synthetase
MAVRGTKDLFRQRAQASPAHRGKPPGGFWRRRGALELITPIFEETQVFEKGVGAATDIVRKEMFTFQDRGGRSLTLRPEGTASMVRAYLEHGMKVWPQPVRLWMAGPMFRAERPQKGRYRQFHQVNYEALGSESPILDAEAIVLLYGLLEGAGPEAAFRQALLRGGPRGPGPLQTPICGEVLTPYKEALSEDSQERLALNPMRILDSKSEKDQALLRELGVKPLLGLPGGGGPGPPEGGGAPPLPPWGALRAGAHPGAGAGLLRAHRL